MSFLALSDDMILELVRHLKFSSIVLLSRTCRGLHTLISYDGYCQCARAVLRASSPYTQTNTNIISEALFDLSKKGNVRVIEWIFRHFKEHANVNFTTRNNVSPLHLASERGHEAVVRLLLTVDGIQVNDATRRNNSTPLYLAAKGGHTAVVRLLLARDEIDVNIADRNGATPLHIAVHCTPVMQLLIKAGANVNITDCVGRTPLEFARMYNYKSAIRLLE